MHQLQAFKDSLQWRTIRKLLKLYKFVANEGYLKGSLIHAVSKN